MVNVLFRKDVSGVKGSVTPATFVYSKEREKVSLVEHRRDVVKEGSIYMQASHVFHRTEFENGTVTQVLRKESENQKPKVFACAGKKLTKLSIRSPQKEECLGVLSRACLRLGRHV